MPAEDSGTSAARDEPSSCGPAAASDAPAGTSPDCAATIEPSAVAQEDRRALRADQRPAALDDQLEHAVEVGLAADREGDRGRRLEPADGPRELGPAPLALLVVARVLDRDGRPRREHDDRILVGLRRTAPRFSVR